MSQLLCLFLFGVLMLSLRTTSEAAQSNFAAHSLSHKIRVNDPTVASQIAAEGGRLVASYDGSHLFEVTPLHSAVLTNQAVELRDDYNFIFLNVRPLDTRLPEMKISQKSVAPFAGNRLHLVQFAGPVRPEWREAVMATGVRLLAYIPQNAYLVYGDNRALTRLQSLRSASNFVQWEGPYLDEYKIHPSARNSDRQGNLRPMGTGEFAIQLVADPEANAMTLQLLNRTTLAPIQFRPAVSGYVNIIATLAPQDLAEIAADPCVVSILPHFREKLRGERQAQILAGNISGDQPRRAGYLAWLTGKGFTQEQFDASGMIVDIADSGIDNGTTAPGHFGLYPKGDLTKPSRVRYSRLAGTPNGTLTNFICGEDNTNSATVSTIQGWDGHGTLTAHIIAGYDDLPNFPHTDSLGYHYGLGICPFVQVGASVVFDPASFTNPDYQQLVSDAYDSGARISNNSWGTLNGAAYDQDAQMYDALVRNAGTSLAKRPMIVVFVAGNQGPAAGTIDSPGTAKNVITVGAAESVESLSIANGGNTAEGNDGSGYPDSLADNANQVATFSGRGPCLDGRMKPDLVAPGTHITGGAPQNSPPPSPDGLGSAFDCFDASGISGLFNSGGQGNTNNFFPLQQEFYTLSTGTSQAAPAVSGACALLWQYFINNGLQPPSPAMAKAFLMNSARYLSDTNVDDSLWSPIQGMGEVNLGVAFDNLPRLLRDQAEADDFTASGQSWTYRGDIANTARPVRVTLVWTDAPGSTVGAALNNDLDLTVTTPGRSYKGNVFKGAYSANGGVADFQNNAESIFLSPGITGSVTVKVSAANINSAGVPNPGGTPRQDFALVVYNVTAAAPSISGVVLSGSSAAISFTSSAWTTYSLQYKNSLSDPEWLALPGTVNGTGGTITLQDPSGAAESRFYRIEAQ